MSQTTKDHVEEQRRAVLAAIGRLVPQGWAPHEIRDILDALGLLETAEGMSGTRRTPRAS